MKSNFCCCEIDFDMLLSPGQEGFPHVFYREASGTGAVPQGQGLCRATVGMWGSVGGQREVSHFLLNIKCAFYLGF